MRNLYEYKRELVKEKKVVVYGIGADARQFARRLFNADIEIDFFLCTLENEIEETYIYNRKVLERNDIDGNDYVIVTPAKNFQNDAKEMKIWGLDSYLVELEILNPVLADARIVIYGTGERAEQTYEQLGLFLNIGAFCDSSEDKWGGRFQGKAVLSPQQIKKEDKVLIASGYYEDIVKTLRLNNIEEKNIVLDYNQFIYKDSLVLYQLGETVGLLGSIYGFDQAFQAFSHDYENHEIVLYGEEQAVWQAKKKLSVIGFSDVLTVYRESEIEDGTIYNLLYEKNSENKRYVLLDVYSDELVEMVTQMSADFRNFQCSNNYLSFYDFSYRSRHQDVFDPNLGFATISEESQYPGFLTYEYLDEKSESFLTIVTLGGSTTTAHCVRNRPWSYYLSEKLKENQIAHRIYCGGNDSYSASQELQRLIRDGVFLRPDIVISYSGANNMEGSFSVLENYPFIHLFQKELFEWMEGIRAIQLKAVGTGLLIEKKVNYGVRQEQSNASFWHEQIKMMQAICAYRKIRFFSFLQPVFFNKARYGKRERTLLADYGFFIEKSTNQILVENESAMNRLRSAVQFMEEAKKINEEWFFDLSGALDESQNVYMDNCHLYEEGNRIIAEYIFDVIRNSLCD